MVRIAYVAVVLKPIEGVKGTFTVLVAASVSVNDAGERHQAISERLTLLIIDVRYIIVRPDLDRNRRRHGSGGGRKDRAPYAWKIPRRHQFSRQQARVLVQAVLSFSCPGNRLLRRDRKRRARQTASQSQLLMSSLAPRGDQHQLEAAASLIERSRALIDDETATVVSWWSRTAMPRIAV